MNKIFSLLAFSVLAFTSCKKETVVTEEHDGKVDVVFDARVGSEDFELNKAFTIGSGTFQFSHLRYWVSNMALVKADGEVVEVPDSYFLVEETEARSIQDGAFQYPAKKRETVSLQNIPMGDYTSIRFSIGVDQQYNDNLSLQAGELSQLNGMTNISWMWHTTYIFSALGGTIESAGMRQDIKVETGINSNYKTITLNLPESIRISSAKSSKIELNVDVANIIDGVDLLATPTIGAGQATAMQTVATNYATKVFTVKAAQ